MTVKELIERLQNIDQDKIVVLGVEGYTTNQQGGEIGVYLTDNSVYIADTCFYEEVDG